MKNHFLLIVLAGSSMFFGCKKEETPTTDKCANKNITLTADITASVACSNNGKLVITAAGSTGFTYQLNSGSFQSSATFSDLAAGSYTITAKDADGCTKSSTFIVTENTTKGAMFTSVQSLMATKCNAACHTAGTGGAPKDIFSTDCKIIERKSLIVAKAVNEDMGGLTTGEKKQISDWIAAGGTIAQ
jgi:uncharacterized membrane protein